MKISVYQFIGIASLLSLLLSITYLLIGESTIKAYLGFINPDTIPFNAIPDSPAVEANPDSIASDFVVGPTQDGIIPAVLVDDTSIPEPANLEDRLIADSDTPQPQNVTMLSGAIKQLTPTTYSGF